MTLAPTNSAIKAFSPTPGKYSSKTPKALLMILPTRHRKVLATSNRLMVAGQRVPSVSVPLLT